MKKFFALIFVAAALTCFAGCGKKEAAPASEPAAALEGGAAPAEKPAEGDNPLTVRGISAIELPPAWTSVGPTPAVFLRGAVAAGKSGAGTPRLGCGRVFFFSRPGSSARLSSPQASTPILPNRNAVSSSVTPSRGPTRIRAFRGPADAGQEVVERGGRAGPWSSTR